MKFEGIDGKITEWSNLLQAVKPLPSFKHYEILI